MNATPKRLVVFDADTNGSTRGASFDPAARDALAQALEGTTAQMVELDQVKLDQIDPDFPQGKLAATGKPSLPAIKRATFDRLTAVATPVPPPPPPPAAPAQPVDPWAAIKVGTVVLASEAKDDGWWEAVVVKLEHNGGTLRLKWRDFPDLAEFTKPLSRVGLPPPAGAR